VTDFGHLMTDFLVTINDFSSSEKALPLLKVQFSYFSNQEDFALEIFLKSTFT